MKRWVWERMFGNDNNDTNISADLASKIPYIFDHLVVTKICKHADNKTLKALRLVCKKFNRYSIYQFKLRLHHSKPKQCCALIYYDKQVRRCPFHIRCPAHGFDMTLQNEEDVVENMIKCEKCQYWTIVKKDVIIYCQCRRN